ncbi:MAG: sigma 54-interacting transcriptional regulator, partial [Gammaproteobacteria bacterium]|nr:sigma 54-interacting transcriptional regulator [Gammaproteobacteria bacterium]
YQIIAANRQYTERYDISTADVVGQKCHKVSHHSEVPCSQHGEHCPLETVFETGKPTQVMHIHYDCNNKEEYVQLQANPIFDEDGNVKYMGEYVNPISQQMDKNGLLIGRSPAIRRLTSILQRVAPTQTTTLLLGESGVGKECVAQYVHQYSNRAEAPFIVVDCGSLGENLIESELFGYEKGAFTGASGKKKGLIESAHGGTLFIDEIGELPMSLQTKLLRVLETGTVRRVGGTEYINVDVRFVAATHRDLKQMVSMGEFREDLYYRLSAFPVNIPPLRERKDDIPLLTEHFLLSFEEGEQYLPLNPPVIESMLAYDYPGNIRELRNIVERAVILAAGSPMTSEHLVFEVEEAIQGLGTHVPQSSPVNSSNEIRSYNDILIKRKNHLTDELVLSALKQASGHRKKAADILGVSERTVYRYMQRLRAE